MLVIGPRDLRSAVRTRDGTVPNDLTELESAFSPRLESILSQGPYDEIHYFAFSRNEVEESLAWIAAACSRDGSLFLNWPTGDATAFNDLTESALATLLKDHALRVVAREETAAWHRLQLAPTR
ncbi:MAG: hypothetical protein KDJ53_09500 [Rhodobiaceae bacterium]|nr:hypothetical protein [Rhodobiaceae bacterium]